jgi:hypothetical protein
MTSTNAIEPSKQGGDHKSRSAQYQARENEQRALALWLKGATFEQVAASGFGITTASGAWRAVRRALARIPKKEADQAREAQLARLQALRLLLWNQAGADPIKAAEALIKLVVCNIENDSKVCYQSACLEQLSDCRGPKLRNFVRACGRGCFAPVTCGGRG